jgi:hypothetical protein
MSDRFQVTIQSEDFDRKKYILVFDTEARVYLTGTFVVSEVLHPRSTPPKDIAFMGFEPALLPTSTAEDMFLAIADALAEDQQRKPARPLEIDPRDERAR